MKLALEEIQLADSEFWKTHDIHQAFATLRRERPVSWQPEPGSSWRAARTGTWAIVRHAHVKFVSREPEIFSSRYGVGVDIDENLSSSFLVMDDPKHRSYRDLVNKRFLPKAVAELAQRVEDHVDGILNRCMELGEFDFIQEVAFALPVAIISELLDCPTTLRPEIIELSIGITDPNPATAKDCERRLGLIGEKLGEQRRHGNGDDLLSMVARGNVAGCPMSTSEVGAYFALLVAAAVDTTGLFLASTMIALSEFPAQQTMWRTNFEALLPTAAEEMLRWTTPVRKFCRTVLRDTEIAGQPIAKGEKVAIWYTSANRDEAVFDRPEVLDLARKPNPHLSFGGPGPHFCLGAYMARQQFGIFFRRLFERAPAFTIGNPTYLLNDRVHRVMALPCRLLP